MFIASKLIITYKLIIILYIYIYIYFVACVVSARSARHGLDRRDDRLLLPQIAVTEPGSSQDFANENQCTHTRRTSDT